MRDEALRAAIGYMLIDEKELGNVVFDLQDRVAREASNASQSVIINWMGTLPLKEGFGDLTVTVSKVGKYEEWIVGRQYGEQLWPIMQWTELAVKND